MPKSAVRVHFFSSTYLRKAVDLVLKGYSVLLKNKFKLRVLVVIQNLRNVCFFLTMIE